MEENLTLMRHLIPLSDPRPHDQSETCWCHPKVIHPDNGEEPIAVHDGAAPDPSPLVDPTEQTP